MHPTIARFMDATRAAEALRKAGALDDDERALHAAAAGDPRVRDALLALKGKVPPSSRIQQEAVVLSVKAAALRLLEHPTLGGPAREAVAALEREGATGSEAMGLVGDVLLDEAFGYADDAASFDEALVEETLSTLPALGRVTEDTVGGWLDTFAGADPPRKALRVAVAEELLDTAWAEGPVPISVEHVDGAMERLQGDDADWTQAKAAMVAFIELLEGQGIVGPLRAARLAQVARTAEEFEATDGPLADEDEDDD